MSLIEQRMKDFGFIAQPSKVEEGRAYGLEAKAKWNKEEEERKKRELQRQQMEARNEARRKEIEKKAEETKLNTKAIRELAGEKYPDRGNINVDPFETPVTDRYKGITQGFEEGKEVKKPARIGDVIDRHNNRFDVTRYQENSKELQKDLSNAVSYYGG